MSEFVVNDKRLFGKEGQINEDKAMEEEKLDPKADNVEQSSVSGPGSQGASDSNPGGLMPPSMASLIIGLATSVIIQLGEAVDPDTPPQPPNFPSAKHTIDLLAVLEKKTSGNLEPEEQSLLSAVLYDLRMKYVAKTGEK